MAKRIFSQLATQKMGENRPSRRRLELIESEFIGPRSRQVCGFSQTKDFIKAARFAKLAKGAEFPSSFCFDGAMKDVWRHVFNVPFALTRYKRVAT